MSNYTNDLFAPVVASVEALEAHRNALSARADALDAVVASLSASARDAKALPALLEGLRMMYVGVPYVFGGNGDTGTDCSGLMKTIFAKIGIVLPRVSADQFRTGVNVAEKEVRLGDLVGIDINDRNGAGIEHIGMAIGNGLMIHTAKPGEGINITDYKKRYGTKIVGYKRLF